MAGQGVNLRHLQRAFALAGQFACTLDDTLFQIDGKRTQRKVGFVELPRFGLEQALGFAAGAALAVEAASRSAAAARGTYHHPRGSIEVDDEACGLAVGIL